MELDLSTIKHVHFIGIGGIGISAIARMMLHEGKKVSGQDMQDSDIIGSLTRLGAVITIGQSYEAVPSDADLIVYTIAIENYDQVLFAKLQAQQEIPIRSYPQMLQIVTKGKYTIAVSGTHGKTTTTGMITQVLRDTHKDPTVVIGSLLSGDKSNFIAGASDLFVVEACEYRRSFLNINPKILVITNVDADHLDYFKDIEDIKSAFRELALKVPSDGFVVCNPNDENIADVVKDIPAKVINYDDFFHPDVKLRVPGFHNKKNASCAFAVGSLLAIPYTDIQKALFEYKGSWRRFEFRGTLSTGALLFDDYAHHPAEIVATLQGFREWYPKSGEWSITVVFQSHLFSRTKLLLKDFAKSFELADGVVVLPIYHAREVDDGTISADILAKEIQAHTPNTKAFKDFDDAYAYLKIFVPGMNSKDVIITMGAGEAFKLGDRLLRDF